MLKNHMITITTSYIRKGFKYQKPVKWKFSLKKLSFEKKKKWLAQQAPELLLWQPAQASDQQSTHASRSVTRICKWYVFKDEIS